MGGKISQRIPGCHGLGVFIQNAGSYLPVTKKRFTLEANDGCDAPFKRQENVFFPSCVPDIKPSC